jgi:hypothetical protein
VDAAFGSAANTAASAFGSTAREEQPTSGAIFIPHDEYNY